MRGVYYSACSLCYKTIVQFHQNCVLMRDCLLFRRLLLPESTVVESGFVKVENLLFVLFVKAHNCDWLRTVISVMNCPKFCILLCFRKNKKK